MLTAITLILSLAHSDSDATARVILSSYAFGKKYTVVITQAALAKAPLWKADADDPPLAARKAMKAAGAVKDRLVKDTDDHKWELHSATLRPADEGRWYWLLTYEANYQKGTALVGLPMNLHLVVLMDGTVLEPMVTDEKSPGRRE